MFQKLGSRTSTDFPKDQRVRFPAPSEKQRQQVSCPSSSQKEAGWSYGTTFGDPIHPAFGCLDSPPARRCRLRRFLVYRGYRPERIFHQRRTTRHRTRVPLAAHVKDISAVRNRRRVWETNVNNCQVLPKGPDCKLVITPHENQRQQVSRPSTSQRTGQ